MTNSSLSTYIKKEIPVHWFPPAPNVFKLNTDGTFVHTKHMGGIGGVVRDSYGNWVIGFSKAIYAYSPVMAELQALHTGLTLALEKQTLPIEVEIDSTEVIELFQYAHPNFQSTIESCMSLLKKLGNPVVRHNFRQGNRLADFLAKEGSILSMNNNSPILAATPADARSILQADKDGVAITRRMSLATCSKLSMLGNLNVLFDVSSSDANIIAHRAPNIIATGSNANIILHRDANIIATTSFVMP